MNYRIGKVDNTRYSRPVNPADVDFKKVYHKFIVAKELDDLVFYSAPAIMDQPSHREIAQLFSLSNVLGGGDVRADDWGRGWKERTTLLLTNDSATYGTVPHKILEKFPLDELLKIYQRLNPVVQSIKLLMCGQRDIDYDKWRRFL
ncbi:hypothetical protein HYW75_02985 [Candidatus Pacearchaeota archaeon]|nr:hypothetical protein [Candidatus Pacearchaeota archaeon]